MTEIAEYEMTLQKVINNNIKFKKIMATIEEDKKIIEKQHKAREMNQKKTKTDQKESKIVQKVSKNDEKEYKMEQKLSEIEHQLSAIKAEMRAEMKTELEKQMKHIKSEEMSERALSTLYKRVYASGEETKEMGVAEERKSNDVELRRMIERVVRGILHERKGKDVRSIIDEHSEELARLKGVSKECLGELEKSDYKMRSMREQLEEEFKGQMTTTGDLIGEILTNLEADNAKMSETIGKLKEGFERDFEELRKKSVRNIAEKIPCLEASIYRSIPQMSSNLLDYQYKHSQPDLSWTISGIAEMTKQKTFEMTSEEFHFTGYDVRARAKLQLKDNDEVHVSLQLSEVTEEVVAASKVIPKVYYWLGTGSGLRSRRVCAPAVCLLGTKFSQSLTFGVPLVHKSWLTDDSVVLDVHVESPSMTKNVHSYDGTLSWAIESYQTKRLKEKFCGVPCQEGPYFYTGSRGYRVQLHLMLNGSGEWKEKGTSAKIYFLNGEYDEELPICFRHRTTVTLVDRKNTGSSICASVEGDVKDRKCYELILGSYKQVEKLLENRTLHCEVKVQAL